MADVVELGHITCPSGELVLTDGGYLSLWSGDRRPEDVPARPGPAVDLAVVGPQAQAAARSFDRQSGTTLYDIPERGVGEFTQGFAEHCRAVGLDAELRALPDQVPHRERVRQAIENGDPGFVVFGVPVVVVGDVPTTTALRVTATYGSRGWARIRIALRDEPVAETRGLGSLYVDHARFVLGDADALSSWIHDTPIDGLADVVFWGRDEAEVAAEFDAPRLDDPDASYGWVDLPAREALQRATDLDRRRRVDPRPGFNFDFRPHSHHWQMMAKVRADEHEAATLPVGGADIMMAMTSIGDGAFPVHLDLDAAGAPTAITIVVDRTA
ncbi:hypothetical protein GCM10027059_37640 [Myceligenerans halotolerans]